MLESWQSRMGTLSAGPTYGTLESFFFETSATTCKVYSISSLSYFYLSLSDSSLRLNDLFDSSESDASPVSLALLWNVWNLLIEIDVFSLDYLVKGAYIAFLEFSEFIETRFFGVFKKSFLLLRRDFSDKLCYDWINIAGLLMVVFVLG